MVQINWEKIMAVKPETMIEQDKDDLYEVIAWYLPDNSIEKKYLLHFIRIAQEILKFKGEQVESLMNELDDIAAKQGEEEARERQDFIDEIEQLKEELEYHKRLSRDSGRPTPGSGEEFRTEIVKLEMKNDELLLELKEREKELMKEKIEAENYASQVATLQREKEDLKRELTALQEETLERVSGKGLQESPEFGHEKQEEFSELIRQKNKHITQLLEDIEVLEKQNLILKSKLTNVCDELSDATNHINEMTMHLSQMKHFNEELEKKNLVSEEKIRSLMEQIEELIEEKGKHDKQLDQFNETLNLKVQEWQETLEAKNMEIIKAEEEIKRLLTVSSKFPEFVDVEMNKKVSEQEQQIVTLKNELVRATQEIDNCTEMIENFKEKQVQLKCTDMDQFQSQFIMYEERIKHLEDKLKYAEEDAQIKAEEMSEIVIQLREYEMGEFGLPEAMNKIKQLEKCLERKDLQIEKLVESCNSMEIEFENYKEQNIALREKLGISENEEIDTTGVKMKYRKDLEVIENLKYQLDNKEEELIKVKLKCQKLVKYMRLKHRISESSFSSSEKVNEERRKMEIMKKYAEEKTSLENRLASIIKENDALRKGMHEILESIHNQDCTGTVEIQSSCLERLLEALDSRHVSGWYHPAMRLQAQLNNAEGKNEELRNQIRSFRQEEKSKNNELQDAYLKIHNLENQLFVLRSPREDVGTRRNSDSELEEIETKNNERRQKQRKTSIQGEQEKIALEIEVQELKLLLNRERIKLNELDKVKLSENEEFYSIIAGLEKQVSALESNLDGDIIDSARLLNQTCVQERQIQFLKQLLETERAENSRLYKEVLEQEEKLFQEILRLQNDKMNYILKGEKLEKELFQSVPKSKLYEMNREISDVTIKYQDAIALSMIQYEDGTAKRLEEEIRLLQRQKNEILDELKIVKEKSLLNYSGSNTINDEMKILVEKLTESEYRELNEKQNSERLETENSMLKSELQNMEAYNREMSECLKRLREGRKNIESEQPHVINEVNNKHDERSALQEKIDQLKRKLRTAENDKNNFRELFEISQNQLRSLESYKEKEKMKIQSLTEQVLLLQSTGDEKAAIARLSHELLNCQLYSSGLEKEKTDFEDRIAKLLANNLILQTRIDEVQEESFEVKRKHIMQLDNLFSVIRDLRKLNGTFTVFSDIETIHKLKKQLRLLNEKEMNQVKELKKEIEEYTVKKQELIIKIDGIDGLVTAFKGDSQYLMELYDKSTSLRLEDARCKRQNQFLTGEIFQLEGYIKKMDEEIINLEEFHLKKEKEWERKQILWEESQREILDLLQERDIQRVSVVPVEDKTTETVSVDENSEGIQKIMEDQAETIKKYESEMQKSECKIKQLKKALNEKSIPVSTASDSKMLPRGDLLEDYHDEAEKAAMKVTIQSLQNIIRQKEDTIYKYQELLKEGRDEYSKSFGKFQEELRMLHEALTKQSKAYNKLKSSCEAGYKIKGGSPKIFEKYLTKIHELEDELTECHSSFTDLNNRLSAVQQDKEKWRNLAEERLSLMDSTRQRLEMEFRNELENYKSEIENYQLENERLKRYMENIYHDGSECQNKAYKEAEVQAKDLPNESDSLKEKAVDQSEKSPKSKDLNEIRILERQLKFAKDEANRLREQLRLLQAQKTSRPKTASSVTSRSGSESKSSLKEESLQSKVKTLEELLKIAKDREQDLIEGNQRRIKSAEEVARWGEKKKAQQTIQNLNSKLKEKEAEVDMLRTKNESFRNMIHKFERDISALEVQLKSAKGGSSGINSKLEKLMKEKSELEKEVMELKEKIEMQQRHESGIGAALLYDKLESQERKLAVLELASKGRSTIMDEVEKLQNAYASLEKHNLKLESEKLELQLQLEKEKALIKRLTDRNVELEKMLRVAEEVSEMRQQESDRTISSLSEKIGKIESRKTCKVTQSSRLTPCPEKLKKDYAKLREDHKVLRAKYLEMVDRNHALEEEIKKYQYQIHLLEEKDLADSISKTNNLQLTSQLSQELLQVKSQLNHKTHLLNRVKVLLTKAAAKEKALNEKVSALQNLVPVAGEA